MTENLVEPQSNPEAEITPADQANPWDVASLLLEFWGLRTEQTNSIAKEIDEVSWNILFDLYVSGTRGRPVVASDLAYAYAVRKSTMIRRVDYLHETGMIRKDPDQLNKVRILLTLTDAGHSFTTETLQKIGTKLANAFR